MSGKSYSSSLVDGNSWARARPLIPTFSSVLQITAGHSESLFEGVYDSDLQHFRWIWIRNIGLELGLATFA